MKGCCVAWHCSDVALFGHFIKIEQNSCNIKLTQNVFLVTLILYYSSTKIFNGADIRGKKLFLMWQGSRVRPNFSRVRLKKNWAAVQEKKKVSVILKVSLWFNNRHTLGPYCGLNQSEIVKGASFCWIPLLTCQWKTFVLTYSVHIRKYLPCSTSTFEIKNLNTQKMRHVNCSALTRHNARINSLHRAGVPTKHATYQIGATNNIFVLF